MKTTIALAFLLAAGGLAVAREGGGPGRPRRPPPEAIDACNGHSAGDSCSVKLRERNIDGTCRAIGDELACVPDGPPPEALDACNGRAVGDACTIHHDDQTFDGVCRRGPDGNGPLACAPGRRPSP